MEVRNILNNRKHNSMGYPMLVVESDPFNDIVNISMEEEDGSLIGKVVEVRGDELIKAIRNAMNH